MPPGDRNKLNRLEELKTKLFSKNYQTKLEHRNTFLNSKRLNVPDTWEDVKKASSTYLEYQEKFFMKTSRFKKFFIFSVAFFLLTLGYAGYVFFFAGNTVSNENIEISILGNSFTAGGEDLSLVIGITNRNSAPLELVDLVIEYPKGDGTSGSAERANFRQSLGTIPAGTVRNENVKLLLYGQQGAVLPIKVFIEYRVHGSNAIFVKEKPYEVSITSTPVNLLVDAPISISPNQDITLNITSMLNATQPLSDVLLKVEYPVGFQFNSSTPPPTLGNNVWEIAELEPGTDNKIVVSGRMIDVFDGEEKSFRIMSGSPSTKDKTMIGVAYNTLLHTVLVKKPFIEANLLVNGTYKSSYTASSKNPIEGTINWRNNLDTKLNDLEIRAKISGNAFNTKTVTAQQGIYNSVEQVLVWDKFSQNQFAEVEPGDFGSVEFTIPPLPLVSQNDGILKDPTINIQVSVSGKQLTEGYETEELGHSESKTIKIISDAGLTARALYSSGPFTNKGPIPPKAEQETTYTIVWSLSNTSNNISKTHVRAILPSWVRFVGPFSPAGEDVSYNTTTREVIWNAGHIPRGAGVVGSAKSVAFQIGFTPLFSQINTLPNILNETILTGHDDFANVDVKVSRPALRTDLAEASFPAGGGIVSQ